MAYKYDQGKYTKIFDEMFGQGKYSSGLNDARNIGTQIGEAKLQAKLLAEQQRAMEAARKEAAKMERERKAKEEKAKKKGRDETALSRQIEDKEFRLKQADVDTSKKQSAIGKKLNLDPDNNLFFDALDIISRPLNAVQNANTEWAEIVSAAKKDLKAGKISEEQYYDRVNQYGFKDWTGDLADGFKGKEGKKKFGSDVLDAMGVENKVGKFTGGLALDVALDPLNAVGGLIGKGITGAAKLTGKGISKLPGADKVLDPLEKVFVGKKAKRQTMGGNETDDLLDLERSMENARLGMHEKSKTDVARSILQGGADRGVRVGKEMEAPLIKPKALDIHNIGGEIANVGNVLNPNKVTGLMEGLIDNNPLKPLSHISNTNMNVVDDILPNGFKPSTQQRLDWGRKGLMPADKVDLGPYGQYAGKQADLGVYGTWGKLGPDVETQVFRYVTSGGDIQKVTKELSTHPSIKSASDTLIKSNADLRKFAAENGIEVKDLEGYMAHFITSEARKHLDETGEVHSFGESFIGGNKKVAQRDIHDSVRNANVKMKQKTGVEQFFNPDAFVSTAAGQQRMINYIAKESVKRKVLDDPRFARELNQGQKARKGYKQIDVDGKRYEVTGGAADVITNFERHITDEGVNSIVKGFDKLQNMWKKTALFSLGFHARNAFGNSWNMYASGLRADEVLRYQGLALGHLDDIQARQVGRSSKKPGKVDKLYEEYLQQGLKNTGSTADFATDVEKGLMKDIRYKTKGLGGKVAHEFSEAMNEEGVLRKTGATVNALFETSKNAGDAADQVSRFGLYLWARKNGMSAKEAGEKVREVLFDYTDLTTAERTVLKRAAPFYTWMRKNAEFQAKAFMKSPEKYARLNQVIENAERSSGKDTDIMPEWMKENMAIPIPGTDRVLSVNPPAADLAKMMNPGKMALDSLTPLAKVPLEIGLNRSSLTGQDIQKYKGETGEVFGKKMPVKLEYLLENMIAPARNLSGAMERQKVGDNPIDTLMKAMGGDLAKKWNQDSFQNQADWKENERLGDLIKVSEKENDTDVQTITELRKQGIYEPDDHRAEASAKLSELGYSQKQTDMLISLKNKVYNRDKEFAGKVALMLQQQGLPPEVIQIVTSEHLDY